MSAVLLIPALLLDAALGEPKILWDRFPHPAVLMGRAVGFAEARLNHGAQRRLKGVAAMLAWYKAMESRGGVPKRPPAAPVQAKTLPHWSKNLSATKYPMAVPWVCAQPSAIPACLWTAQQT